MRFARPRLGYLVAGGLAIEGLVGWLVRDELLSVAFVAVLSVAAFMLILVRVRIALADADLRQRSEADTRRLAAIAESSSDGIIGTTVDGVIVTWNAGAARMYGYAADEVQGRRLSLLWPGPNDSALIRILDRVNGGEDIRRVEATHRRKDHEPVDVSLTFSPVRGREGSIVGVSVISGDITERKRIEAELREAQQALQTTNRELETKVEERTQELRQSLHTLAVAHDERRQLLSRLVTAQEEERKRIAHDIHDDTIQKMAGVALRLDVLELDNPEMVADAQFEELSSSVREAIGRLRRLMFDLRPQILDKPGLGKALSAYVEELSGRDGGFAFDVQSDLAEEPPEDLRLTLFRIAQEALNNVVNHARARNVSVRVEDRDGGVLVRIADDGVGFEVGDRPVSPPGHLGLTAMRERAEIARGWLKLSSRPGEGTSVDFWIPGPEEGPA